jgi:acetoin utilization deacetylase AcuC-like enzyme
VSGRGFGLALDRGCLAHVAGPLHPERPARLEAIEAALARAGLLAAATAIPPRLATEDDLRLVHAAAHLARVRAACATARPPEPDTGVRPESWDAALRAAGAAIEAADRVAAGTLARAFCAVRPPGHHATPDESMGFCLFNNVAIAARHLLARRGLARVAIVDFDVHHGNGTQAAFWTEGRVLFASIHQYGPNPLDPSAPFYPGTGAESETGEGGGAGTTVNVPLPAGATYALYERAIRDRLAPSLDAFKPELLLLSAGFDAHRLDPLASIELDTEDFGRLTRELVAIADRLCGGRIVSVLEGGYHLDALGASAAEHVRALAEAAGR